MGNAFSPFNRKQEQIDGIADSLTDIRQTDSSDEDILGWESLMITSTRQKLEQETENDSIIAAILSLDSDSDREIEGSSEAPRAAVSNHGDAVQLFVTTDDDSDADEDLQVRLALARAESMDDMVQPISSVGISSSATSGVTADVTTVLSANQPPTCPICTQYLSSGPETGEDANEAPVRTFCPACTQPYHNACLARWFSEDRDAVVCPMCRTEMEDDFVEEVRNL